MQSAQNGTKSPKGISIAVKHLPTKLAAVTAVVLGATVIYCASAGHLGAAFDGTAGAVGHSSGGVSVAGPDNIRMDVVNIRMDQKGQ
jgi:hypothetical protein